MGSPLISPYLSQNRRFDIMTVGLSLIGADSSGHGGGRTGSSDASALSKHDFGIGRKKGGWEKGDWEQGIRHKSETLRAAIEDIWVGGEIVL